MPPVNYTIKDTPEAKSINKISMDINKGYSLSYLLNSVYGDNIESFFASENASRLFEETKNDQESLSAWQERIIDLFDQKIFNGYTPSGTARYLPFTLGNINKILNGKEKEASGWGGSSANGLASVILPRLKTLEQVKKQADKLLSLAGKYDQAYIDLSNKLAEIGTELMSDNPDKFKYTFADDTIKWAYQDGFDRVEKQSGIKFSQNVRTKMAELAKSIAELPRTYFESKVRRPVMMEEISAASVPTTSDYDSISDALMNRGIKVERYTDKPNESKIADSLLFQRKGTNGYFDPELQVIVLGKNTNSGTLPHEMSHFWLEKMFNMVMKEQNITPELANSMSQLFKILGVSEDQTKLTIEQHEQFANMSEAVYFPVSRIARWNTIRI